MTQQPASPQATFCATLVDQWVRLGLQHAVVAPGSRSTPMALALASHSDITVHVAHDERTASFIALGIGLSTSRPAALLCTSGTAATHFHAAVVEADLAGVPMLVLTADRPPELQGIGAPQTIDQIELYGAVVRCFADPGVAEAADAPYWRDWATDWWLSSVDGDRGPVHVNLAFREPLVGVTGELPAADPVADELVMPDGDGWFMMRPDMAALAAMLSVPHGVIVAGRGIDDVAAVGALADALGWPVFADPRSSCRALPQAISSFDSLLRAPTFASANVPAAVLHLGEAPASKVLGQWLQEGARSGSQVHVQVHLQQRTIDPLGIIDERVYGSPGTLCDELAPLVQGARDAAWLDRWQRADRTAQQAITATIAAVPVLSEPAVARVLSDAVPQLVLSSSMPVRDVEWFGVAGSTSTVHSNRGANGIDGVIATAIGVAIGSAEQTALLIGDVAFCHDQSSLTALRSRIDRERLDLTIVVTDNDGGGIFSFLPQATQLQHERFEQLFGTPHGTDLVALASAHGLGAVAVADEAALRAAIADRAITVVRVETDRAENVAVHEQLHAAVASALG